MEKKQLVILIIAVIVAFVIGGGLGVALQSQGTQATKVEAVNSLASKVVTSMVAYGKVENIAGRNIALSNVGDNLTILMADNAQVYSFTTPKTGSPVQQTVSFSNIKVGDNVNIAIKLLPTGKMQGASVVILPHPAQ